MAADFVVRDMDEVFEKLAASLFRAKFHLGPKERAYLDEKGMTAVLDHAGAFIATRLGPAHPAKDGKQTPWRGHPVFVAQHATGTCCRGCLEKWHGIPRGAELTDEQQAHAVAAIARWLKQELADAPATRRPGSPAPSQASDRHRQG